MEASDVWLFIYDAKQVQNEEDDPLKAIRYFHPVSYDKNLQCALCGSIVGMCNALRQLTDTFPRTITLQSLKFNVVREEDIIIGVGGQKSNFHGQEKKLLDLVDIIVLRFSSISSMLQHWDEFKIVDDVVGILRKIQPLSCLDVSYDMQMKTILLMENITKQTSLYGLSLFHDDKLLHSTADSDFTLKLCISRMFLTDDDSTVKTQRSTICHFPVYVARKVLEQMRFFNNLKIRKAFSLQQKMKNKRELASRHVAPSSSDSEENQELLDEASRSGDEQNIARIELVIIRTNRASLFVLKNYEALNLELCQKWEKVILQLGEQLDLKSRNYDETLIE